MAVDTETRDTDSDWIKIGAENPYWGVLSSDRYDRCRISAADIEEFFRTGESEIGALAARTASFLGEWPTIDAALDFGCGAGRLSHAMTRWAHSVTGYDISLGMLDIARRRFKDAPNLRFMNELPQEAFGWINSFIVFQHIPPKRGLAILQELLSLLAPGGIVTLHFTLYREDRLIPPSPRIRTGIVRALRKVLGRSRQGRPAPTGAVHMYDYPLDVIIRRLNEHGMDAVLLIHTNHGGHHGAQVIARRAGS